MATVRPAETSFCASPWRWLNEVERCASEDPALVATVVALVCASPRPGVLFAVGRTEGASCHFNPAGGGVHVTHSATPGRELHYRRVVSKARGRMRGPAGIRSSHSEEICARTQRTPMCRLPVRHPNSTWKTCGRIWRSRRFPIGSLSMSISAVPVAAQPGSVRALHHEGSTMECAGGTVLSAVWVATRG